MKTVTQLESMFKPFSIGIVHGDKARNSYKIQVFPIENQFGFKGKLSMADDITSKTTNELEELTTHHVKLGQTMEVTWLPISQSNRISAPDVCNGERVMIYKFGESDTYYWDTIFHEHDIRKKEQFMEGVSNTDDLNKVLEPDLMYWRSLDTVEKEVVLISTAKNDGEFTTHKYDIDTEKGVVKYADGLGNFWKMESDGDKYTLNTNKKIHLVTKDVVVDCENYTINCKTYTLNGKTLKWNGTDSTLTSASLKLNGSSYQCNYASYINNSSSVFKTSLTTTGAPCLFLTGLLSKGVPYPL